MVEKILIALFAAFIELRPWIQILFNCTLNHCLHFCIQKCNSIKLKKIQNLESAEL